MPLRYRGGVAAKDPTKKRRRYGWRTPKWKDPAFWTAVGISALLVVAQAFLIGDRGTLFWYLNLIAMAVVIWIIVSAVMRVRIGIQRGLVGGFQESQEKAAAKPGGTTADNLAKASGRTVGRYLAAYKKSQSKPPS